VEQLYLKLLKESLLGELYCKPVSRRCRFHGVELFSEHLVAETLSAGITADAYLDFPCFQSLPNPEGRNRPDTVLYRCLRGVLCTTTCPHNPARGIAPRTPYCHPARV
jgi:hypothetical protein